MVFFDPPKGVSETPQKGSQSDQNRQKCQKRPKKRTLRLKGVQKDPLWVVQPRVPPGMASQTRFLPANPVAKSEVFSCPVKIGPPQRDPQIGYPSQRGLNGFQWV